MIGPGSEKGAGPLWPAPLPEKSPAGKSVPGVIAYWRDFVVSRGACWWSGLKH